MERCARAVALCLFGLIALPAAAQTKLHLEFESSGPRVGWFASELGAPPDTAPKWDGKSFDLDVTGARTADVVQILDTSSGNLAVRSIKDCGKGWLVKDGDFKVLGSVRVRVEHEGAPVANASVSVNDGRRTQVQLVDPSVKGDVAFFGVMPGQFKVSVAYRSNGSAKNQTVSFPLELKRDEPVPSLVVSLSSPVQTVAVQQSGAPARPRSQTPQTKTNPVAEIFLYLLVLCVVLLLVYGGLTWLRKNPDQSRATLQKLGVHTGDPGDPGFSAPAMPTPAPPAPQILLSDSDPTPLVPTAFAAPKAGNPRIVGAAGRTFDIDEGCSVVGRDPGLAISLNGESSVSRRHAELQRTGSRVVLRDVGSTNGTFVNGAKTAGDVLLETGDAVQFGSVRFRYEA